MSHSPYQIVVVTPVKNEAWILDRFLAVTSEFADHIIILDQCSQDGSTEIYGRYPKVTVVANPSEQYDEASRQILLLEKAREIVPGPRIILALDTDEILAADAMQTVGWQTMLKAKPGSVLFFEKPDLYLTSQRCLRHDQPWPLGYVDDGAPHTPKKVHSIRIPLTEKSTRLYINDIKILHYALTRPQSWESKIRFYSVVENLLQTKPSMSKRRAGYPHDSVTRLAEREIQPCPPEWFAAWEKQGIDMHTIETSKYYWQDFEVLRKFAQHGVRRFYHDDIWNFDWEACRQYALRQQMDDMPNFKIVPPSAAVSLYASLAANSYVGLRKLRSRISGNKSTIGWL